MTSHEQERNVVILDLQYPVKLSINELLVNGEKWNQEWCNLGTDAARYFRGQCPLFDRANNHPIGTLLSTCCYITAHMIKWKIGGSWSGFELVDDLQNLPRICQVLFCKEKDLTTGQHISTKLDALIVESFWNRYKIKSMPFDIKILEDYQEQYGFPYVSTYLGAEWR